MKLAAKTAPILAVLAALICLVACMFSVNRMDEEVWLEACLSEILWSMDADRVRSGTPDMTACLAQPNPEPMFWAVNALFMIGWAGLVLSAALALEPRLRAFRVRLTATAAAVVFAGATLGFGFREGVSDIAGLTFLASALLWALSSLCYEQQAILDRRALSASHARRVLRRAATRGDSLRTRRRR